MPILAKTRLREWNFPAVCKRHKGQEEDRQGSHAPQLLGGRQLPALIHGEEVAQHLGHHLLHAVGYVRVRVKVPICSGREAWKGLAGPSRQR